MIDHAATPSLPAKPAQRSRPVSIPQTSAEIRKWFKPIETFIADHPGASLASALILGVAFAWWIKRR